MTQDESKQMENVQEPQGYKEWRERERKYLEDLEEMTTHPMVEQEKILRHILKKNAETSYLQEYELNGATDVDSFRARLPLSDYTLYKKYLDRIYRGDISPLLCADPVVELMASSGTSGGDPKLFPVTAEDLELRNYVWSLMRPCLNRELPDLEKGKVLFFYFIRTPQVAPCGLVCNSAVTSFAMSSFKTRPFDPSYILTSPDEVVQCFHGESVMYCHLLLGLLQREEVVRLGAIYPPVLQKALLALGNWLEELCEDLTKGTLSPIVTDETVRLAVQPLLRQDPELAEYVRSQFSPGRSSDGIIRRLWPNVKVIDTVCTGSMEGYLPALANLTDNMPVICTQLYAATEGYFGVNVHAMSPPEEISYTLIPVVAYYEFIAVSMNGNGPKSHNRSYAGHDEILDLGTLQLGQEYELIVTTVSGLYRYRMGDVLKVVGFYNSAPLFQFVRRMNTILSVDMDKTDEKELHIAVNRATKVLERELGLRLHDYTSTADLSTKPGHYVIFWELQPASQSPTQEVLEECCSVMETAFNFVYRRGRHEKAVGPLEIRLVQEGTFDLLVSHAVSKGSNLSQYKTPRGIGSKNSAVLQILDSRVLGSYLSQQSPHFVPGLFRPTLSGRNLLKESLSSRSLLLEESKAGAVKIH